jgi:hypothetical protein
MCCLGLALLSSSTTPSQVLILHTLSPLALSLYSALLFLSVPSFLLTRFATCFMRTSTSRLCRFSSAETFRLNPLFSLTTPATLLICYWSSFAGVAFAAGFFFSPLPHHTQVYKHTLFLVHLPTSHIHHTHWTISWCRYAYISAQVVTL